MRDQAEIRRPARRRESPRNSRKVEYMSLKTMLVLTLKVITIIIELFMN
jgi:hypothetical protein